MKYLSKITLGLILCAGLVTSCKDDDEPGIPGGIAVDKEEIAIGPEGGIEKIAVSSDYEWVANASKPWITVSPANGSGITECSLAIDTTLENTSRTAQIRFALAGHEPKMITITQFGFGKQIVLKEPEVEIENSAEHNKRYFEATISTNINFKIDKTVDYAFADAGSMTEEEKQEMEPERANWLQMPQDKDLEVNLDRKARPRTIKVRFLWEMNTAPFTRVAKIRLVPQNPEEDQLVDDDGKAIEAVYLTVTQKPAMKIENNRSGDSLAIITINQKIQSMTAFDTSENMQNWENVTLWEATDKNLPEPEAVGRIRSVRFAMFNMQDGETLPKEIRYLRYMESLILRSNENRQIRKVSLCDEISELKYLKELTVDAYGLTELPENFIKLGGAVESGYVGLERLDLGSNNFASLPEIMDVINENNFPKLISLDLGGCRRTDIIKDLSEISGTQYNGKEVGLRVNLNMPADKEAFMKLLTWDKLVDLSLTYNFIEGKLPTDVEMEAALSAARKNPHYTSEDFFTEAELKTTPSIYLEKISNDTCQWLLTGDNTVTFTQVDGTALSARGNEVPRVLPKARWFSFNLNYLTGPLPKWILFHPYFVSWNPETFVFGQELDCKDSAKDQVGFNNIDVVKFDYSYYYGKEDPGTDTQVWGVAYPLYYRKFVAN